MSVEEIKELLKKYYGAITDQGCYINGRWLSIEAIIKIIERGY